MLATIALTLFIGFIFMPIYFTIETKQKIHQKKIHQVLSVSDDILRGFVQEVFSFFFSF